MTYIPEDVFKNILKFTDDRIERRQKELMRVIVDDFIKKRMEGAVYRHPGTDYDIPTYWRLNYRTMWDGIYRHRKLEQRLCAEDSWCAYDWEDAMRKLNKNPNAFRTEEWREEQRKLIDYSETCNPPCKRDTYIGRSWWKCRGFHRPCECAHYIDNMHVKYDMPNIPMKDWKRECEEYKQGFAELERIRKERILLKKGFNNLLWRPRRSTRIHFNKFKNMFINSKIIIILKK